MTAPKPQRNSTDRKLARKDFDRARHLFEESLSLVHEQVAAAAESLGELKSVEVLREALRASGKPVPPIEDDQVSQVSLTESLLWLDELSSTALASEILDDLEQEAQESETAHAANLLAGLREVQARLETYREAHRAISPYLQKEDAAMANGDPRNLNIRVTADTSSGGAAATKVQRQLISTLDSLGMPHRAGLLGAVGPDDNRLAGRLMESLERRFDVRDDPISGMRAVARRSSTYDRNEDPDGELTGRLAIAAEAAIAITRQIGLTLDDLLRLADTLEEWPINDQARIESVRDRAERQLEVLRDLAAKPGGPPLKRCDYELDVLRQSIAQLLTALGLKRTGSAGQIPDWTALKRAFAGSLAEVSEDLGSSVREELDALFDQLFEQGGNLQRQLANQDKLSASETSYHLRRILEAISAQVEATRAAMEESTASAAWVGASTSSDKNRFLADDLEEALSWLEELSANYGLSDRAYEEMRPAAVIELRGALSHLGGVVGDCIGALRKLGVLDDEVVGDCLTGLQKLIQSARTLTGDGSAGSSGAPRSQPKSSSNSRKED